VKRCHTCGIDRPLSAFHKQAERPDGLCYHCKFCERRRAAAYYLEHKETRKAYAREYGKRYGKKIRARLKHRKEVGDE
jgi:hypothetical protein